MARVSRISSAVLVQTKGLGSLFHSLIHLRMSVSSSVTLRSTDLRSLRLVNSADQRSRLVRVPARRLLLQSGRDHLLDLFVGHRPGPAGPLLVVQPLQPATLTRSTCSRRHDAQTPPEPKHSAEFLGSVTHAGTLPAAENVDFRP